MRFTFFLIFVIVISCDTERQIIENVEVNVPISIANNFTMTYTDSSQVKSYVSGNKHFDFSNNILNYSEFFDDVELIIYDDNKTSTIKSDYAIVYLSLIHI